MKNSNPINEVEILVQIQEILNKYNCELHSDTTLKTKPTNREAWYEIQKLLSRNHLKMTPSFETKLISDNKIITNIFNLLFKICDKLNIAVKHKLEPTFTLEH